MQDWIKVLNQSILFQDEHVVVVNKPYDLPSQGKSIATSNIGNQSGSSRTVQAFITLNLGSINGT
jgi:23S rRNA-/tRNA-specific pseudouridylate synthase